MDVLDGSLPALQGGALFEFQNFPHDQLPTAVGHQRINGYQIGAGDLQVDGRLLMRFVFGIKNPLRGALSRVCKLACLRVTRSSIKKMPLLSSYQDWDRYVVFMLLLFQAVIGLVAVSLFLGQFTTAILILAGFSLVLVIRIKTR